MQIINLYLTNYTFNHFNCRNIIINLLTHIWLIISFITFINVIPLILFIFVDIAQLNVSFIVSTFYINRYPKPTYFTPLNKTTFLSKYWRHSIIIIYIKEWYFSLFKNSIIFSSIQYFINLLIPIFALLNPIFSML